MPRSAIAAPQRAHRDLRAVIAADAGQRQQWLDRARAIGSRLDTARSRRRSAACSALVAWLAALRLQFYPMTWIAYTVGALAASAGHRWQ